MPNILYSRNSFYSNYELNFFVNTTNLHNSLKIMMLNKRNSSTEINNLRITQIKVIVLYMHIFFYQVKCQNKSKTFFFSFISKLLSRSDFTDDDGAFLNSP